MRRIEQHSRTACTERFRSCRNSFPDVVTLRTPKTTTRRSAVCSSSAGTNSRRLTYLSASLPPRYSAFSQSGSYLAVAVGSSVHVWRTPDGVKLGELELGRNGSSGKVAFSSDERFFAATCDTDMLLARTDSLQVAHRLKGHIDWTTYAEFSRDSRNLITLAADAVPHIYDPVSGETRHVLRHSIREQCWGAAARFCRNGKWLAGGGRDGASLWDSSSGQLIESFVAPDTVRDVRFSDDEHHLVGLTSNDIVCTWDIVHLGVEARNAIVWLEALTGTQLDKSNQIRLLSADEIDARRRELKGGNTGASYCRAGLE